MIFVFLKAGRGTTGISSVSVGGGDGGNHSTGTVDLLCVEHCGHKRAIEKPQVPRGEWRYFIVN